MNIQNRQKQVVNLILVHGRAGEHGYLALYPRIHHKTVPGNVRDLGHERTDIGVFQVQPPCLGFLPMRHGHKGKEKKQDNGPQNIDLVVIHLAISSCFDEPGQRHCSGMA